MKTETVQYDPLNFKQSITINLDAVDNIDIIENGIVYSIKDYIRKMI